MSNDATIFAGLGAKAGNLFKSRPFWFVVVIIILLLLLWKFWGYIGDKFKPLFGDFSGGISNERKDELSTMVQEFALAFESNFTTALFSVLFGAAFIFTGDDQMSREDTLIQLLAMNDSELYWSYKYYRKYFDKNMIKSIDSAWMPFDDEDELIIIRLEGMGLS